MKNRLKREGDWETGRGGDGRKGLVLLAISVLCLSALVLACECHAASPMQTAAARVAVALAQLEVADSKPQLEDRPPRETSGDAPVVTVETSGDAQSVEATPNFVPSPEPMRMEFARQAVVSEVLPAQLIITCWEKGCPVGARQERDVVKQLRPLNWRIGDADDDQIRFVHGPPDQPCPTIELYQNGSVIQRWESYQDPRTLSHALRKAWDDAGDHPNAASQATGAGGDIHASQQIRQTFDYLRKYVGEGNRSTMQWSRNGSPALSLFAMGDWDAVGIFGTDGRIQLDSPDAINLPTKSLAFGYRIIGRDMILDADPVRFAGMADRLSLSGSRTRSFGETPVGIIGIDDALEVYWVICMFKDIFALLRPSADLTLPNEVSGNAVLNGDTLTVQFDKPPVVKLVWMFTFKLAVKKVVVTEKNVHVEFSGSRWIKSRDFQVK